MTDWRVVAELAVLVPLAIAIIKPLLKLNTVLTKLDSTVANLQTQIEEQRAAAKEAHRAINAHIDEVERRTEKNSKQIQNHEFRIGQLEKNGGAA